VEELLEHQRQERQKIDKLKDQASDLAEAGLKEQALKRAQQENLPPHVKVLLQLSLVQ
jgi:hypothetical protein